MTKKKPTSISRRRPLCVDLDGTLYKGDFFLEELVSVLLEKPFRIFQALARFGGIASLKEFIHLGRELRLEPEDFRPEVLNRLKEEARRGRKIFLVTAAHESVANTVSKHLGFFAGVFSTRKGLNLKGKKKQERLLHEFGAGGYEYFGDSESDRFAMETAFAGLWFNRSTGHLQSREADRRVHSLAAIQPWIRLIRPHQWAKNLLVFLPLLASGQLGRTDLWVQATLVFTAFCLVASAGYVANDIADVRADRRHLEKGRRPLAAGILTLPQGVVLFFSLVALALVPMRLLDAGANLILLGYFVLSLFYSHSLKKLPLLDIFTLSALYLSRVVAGGFAADTRVSSWLLMFVGFAFCGMAALKRYTELLNLVSAVSVARRGYLAHEHDLLGQISFLAMGIAGLVLALYARSPEAALVYRHPERMMLAGFLWFGWSAWLVLQAKRQNIQSDPVSFCLRDRVTWFFFVSLVLIYGWSKWG
jgi:4-hydroxybenzoate polyprenyltransferase/phosphoserine phosphatase